MSPTREPMNSPATRIRDLLPLLFCSAGGHLLLFPVELVKENGLWKIRSF
jgi:hypothetical protein